MSDSTNITMKDIARDLGVSVATVSRALKDSPRISAEKREEIKKYAQEHNFYPNILAESLRKSKVQPMKIIGVIVPQLAHVYFSSILSGIEEEASSRGYRLMVAQSKENYENEVKICRAFSESKVCGIIVSQAKNTTKYDHFQTLLEKGVPLVFYDYGTSLTMEIAKKRYNGYRDALLKNGMHPDEQLIKNCDNRADAELITPDVMQLPQPPDAFFAVNDDTAIGILYSCKRLGFRVPEDVSICGFTNGQRAIACDPMLTTVEQRGVRVGEEAASILIDQVEGRLPKNRVERRVVRTRLILRGTTR